jgi:hypothetical protein
MDASYKKKLKIIRDEQFGNSYEKDKIVFPKIFVLIITILSILYLSNFI